MKHWRVRKPVMVAAAATAVAVCVALSVPSAIAGAGPRRSSSATSSWGRLLDLSSDLGPSKSSISVVVKLRSPGRPVLLDSWAERHDLAVTWDKGESFALLFGSAHSVSEAFATSVDNFVSRTGIHFYASRSEPRVPDPIKSVVDGIGSLTNYGRPVQELMTPDYVPAGGLTPSELVEAYQATGLTRGGDLGQGETVVFLEAGPFEQSDLNTFDNQFHLPAVQVSFSGGNASGGASESGEADMDIETVHAIAPDAKLVYFNLNTTHGFSSDSNQDAAGLLAQALADAASNFKGALVSASLGVCELGYNSNDIGAISAAAQSVESEGGTVISSSGDSGGADCGSFGADSLSSAEGVVFPAVSPDVTGVGGTSLSVTSNGGYVGETTWSSPMLSLGSGGGVSTLVSRPSWQTGPGVGDEGVPDMREVPDVSADADPVTGVAMVSDNQFAYGGGTSLAAPIWAGIVTLIDEYLRSNGAKPVGFFNPLVYRLASDTSLTPTPFHDVTVGGNVFYQADQGYSPVTGVGSPNASAIATYALKVEKTGTP